MNPSDSITSVSVSDLDQILLVAAVRAGIAGDTGLALCFIRLVAGRHNIGDQVAWAEANWRQAVSPLS
ncbi:MAG TPA: hypothetical protein VM533_02070 [Fimbriiglobus sp.]|jgi:hypothetical protein|nr:hypothetical protein [Fimbriiglobus sp.]